MSARYPFHRSLVLWGALLVMAFAGWAWVDSREMDSHLIRGDISAGSGHNGIYAVRWSSLSPATRVEPRRNKMRITFPEEVAPPPFFLRGSMRVSTGANTEQPEEAAPVQNVKEFIARAMSRHPPEAWIIFIPYWLLTAATALVAGGLILWRAKKWRQWQRMQEEGSTMGAVG